MRREAFVQVLITVLSTRGSEIKDILLDLKALWPYAFLF